MKIASGSARRAQGTQEGFRGPVEVMGSGKPSFCSIWSGGTIKREAPVMPQDVPKSQHQQNLKALLAHLRLPPKFPVKSLTCHRVPPRTTAYLRMNPIVLTNTEPDHPR